jgi:hypothetical protein
MMDADLDQKRVDYVLGLLELPLPLQRAEAIQNVPGHVAVALFPNMSESDALACVRCYATVAVDLLNVLIGAFPDDEDDDD